MSGETVRVEGLTELDWKLDKLARALPLETKKINFDAAMIVAKAAGSRVPIGETGKLARSIRAKSNKFSAYVTAGSPSVPYAAPIHWGWDAHNIVGQPFLYESLDEHLPEVFGLYEERVPALIEREGL